MSTKGKHQVPLSNADVISGLKCLHAPVLVSTPPAGFKAANDA